MFCCVRTRGRKEGKTDYPPQPQPVPPPPPLASYGYDEKGTKSAGNGPKDGNMAVLAGAGVAVAAATVATAAVVSSDGD
ncbi:hypothetical protein BUALT_Bualt18G0034800 [Buddleja alternifolia]|uniref:Uncharacterized protein n=1 Tax=Buddleja alternifolia TaxID=168488 RepID=A0AAV6W399_9LAMI|nr:hypothetical protein BUALT_Bualt18G0034800 [Buddleja alternifolia]